MTVLTDQIATVAEGRARIDELDATLLDLVRERIEVSRAIQRVRLAEGGPRVTAAREGEILARYRDELGQPGTKLALTLLELGRGPLS